MTDDNIVKHDLSKINYVIFHTFRRQWLLPSRPGQTEDRDIDWTSHVDDAGAYTFGESRQFMLRWNRVQEANVLAVPEFMAEYVKPM